MGQDKHDHDKKKDDSENPKDVGESDLRHGEDVVEQEGKEPGRYDTGKKGPSQRSTGKSTPRDQTGVSVPPDPKKSKAS